MIQNSDQKKQDVLDRYEIVGIAVPGAALVAVLWYLAGQPGGDNIADISIGSLGAFTIAAFVAGHVVQSIANVFEDSYSELTGAPTMIPVDGGALARNWIANGLREFGLRLANGTEAQPAPDGLSYLENNLHGTRGKELRRIILSEIRAGKRSRMLDNLKITVAVSRGLCVVSFVAAFLEIVLWKLHERPLEPVTLAVAIAVGVVTFLRARRYTDHFEREIWIQFAELHRPKADA